MSHGRVGRVLGVAGLVGIMVLPFAAPTTSSADSTPSGLAKASSLSLSLSPQALAALALPQQLLSALNVLPCGVGTALGNALTSTTTVALDAASNDGTLNNIAGDLLSGEATSEAVHIGLAGIDQVVSGVQGILNGDLSCLTGGAGANLPVNVSSLLSTLTGQLGNITAPLNGILGQLNANLNINQVLHVLLDQTPATSDVLNLTAPLINNLQLGPFDAVAVSQAGAQKYGVTTGPQLEAHNSTTNLGIGESLPLGSLGNITGTISSLTSTLQSDLSSLTGASNLLGGLTGSTATGSALTSVCSTISGLLPSLNCSTLPVTDPTAALSQLTSLTPQLGSLGTTLQNLLSGLPGLSNILSQLPTSLNLADLIQTAGDTSSVLTQPQNGGVHSIATTSFADLKVLQLLGNGIPGLFPNGSPIQPLLELKGISSSAEALVNGIDSTAPNGTVSLGELDVLGHAIQLSSLGTGQTITIPTPLGDLTVVIAIGQPQTVNNSPNRKTIQASALTVQIINGDGNGNNPITLLGVKSDPTILDLEVAGTQVDDSMTPVPTVQAATTSTAKLPSTGMMGPIGFVGVGALGLTAAGLRFASRRRRVAGAAAPGSASELEGSEPEPLSLD